MLTVFWLVFVAISFSSDQKAKLMSKLQMLDICVLDCKHCIEDGIERLDESCFESRKKKGTSTVLDENWPWQ